MRIFLKLKGEKKKKRKEKKKKLADLIIGMCHK